MRYTIDENGVLNNYAAEPAMYYAEYPSPAQQQRYLFQAAIAVLLVATSVFVAISAS